MAEFLKEKKNHFGMIFAVSSLLSSRAMKI
jgi:hypothetical protein